MFMDPGYRSPLVDLFRRGAVAQDVRLEAAQGTFAPRAHEQLALLILLSDDPDAMVSATARATLDELPAAAVAAFLARSDVPAEMREFFAGRGVEPAQGSEAHADDPLGPAPGPESGAAPTEADPKILAGLPVPRRIKLAILGTREQRAQLIRDSNKLVAAAVLSSPKLTVTEVEGFARMTNVTEDVLRVISGNRGWLKRYAVVVALVRNPKTPPAISMTLLSRLNEHDAKLLAADRNVPEVVRFAARKLVMKSRS